MQEKMKFVFNYTTVTNRTESIVVGSLIIYLPTYVQRSVEHRSDRLSRKQNLPKQNEDLKYELMQNYCNETETRIAIPVIKG